MASEHRSDRRDGLALTACSGIASIAVRDRPTLAEAPGWNRHYDSVQTRASLPSPAIDPTMVLVSRDTPSWRSAIRGSRQTASGPFDMRKREFVQKPHGLMPTLVVGEKTPRLAASCTSSKICSKLGTISHPGLPGASRNNGLALRPFSPSLDHTRDPFRMTYADYLKPTPLLSAQHPIIDLHD